MPFEAIKFDYGNVDEWKSYFEELKDLARSCKMIVEFWEELKRKCDGLTFKDLQEEFDYSTVLLGGVTPDGEYKERSLAKVYAVLFGFKPENVHDLIEKLKKGYSQDTKVIVEKTRFIEFVKNILETLERILTIAESKGLIDSADIDVRINESKYYEILADYKKLIEILNGFVNKIAKILPNYNERSLFVWTIDKLTYKYMTTAYPKLRDDKVFEFIRDLLGLDVIFSPNVEDKRAKKDYSIYSYSDELIGKHLIELFKIIWNTFDDKNQHIRDALSLIFPEISNFKKEFYELVSQALIGMNWRFPNVCITSDEQAKDCYYVIDGITLREYRLYVYESGSKVWKPTSVTISLLKLLDELMPGLFLLKYILFDLKIYKTRYYITTTSYEQRYELMILSEDYNEIHTWKSR